MFSTISFLARQIIGIMGLQIEIIIFFFSGNNYKLKEMSFTIRHFKKIGFCWQKLAN
jgi:hypothetical protein